MGAWGFRPFENDYAGDWLGEFLEQPGKRILAKTFRDVLKQPAEDRELPEESAAVAAAEIVACLAGRRGKELDDDLTEWLDQTSALADKPLVKLAMDALDAVQADGELCGSFDAAGRRKWLATIKELRGRLETAQSDKQLGKRRPPREDKPKRQRLRHGDIVEFKVSRGFAYAQYINDHKNYDTVVRVLPGVYSRRPDDFETIVAKEGGWCAFWYIKEALKRQEATIVGHASIPKPYRKFPTFKLADRSIGTALVRGWSIWEGQFGAGRPVEKLTEEQRRYPLAETLFTEHVVKRINKGWKPEDECLPGAMSIDRPMKIPKEVLARRKAAEKAAAETST